MSLRYDELELLEKLSTFAGARGEISGELEHLDVMVENFNGLGLDISFPTFSLFPVPVAAQAEAADTGSLPIADSSAAARVPAALACGLCGRPSGSLSPRVRASDDCVLEMAAGCCVSNAIAQRSCGR